MRNKITCLIGIVLATTALYSAAGIPASERNALMTFYEATAGDNWTNNSGWLNAEGSECSWFGVFCNEAESHVSAIVLQSNNLGGHLPPELAHLTELTDLWLGTDGSDSPLNQIGGQIPPELGALSHLQNFSLWDNIVTGEIPAELGNLGELLYLDFDGNNLTGAIPAELGQLINLEALWLSKNNLSGSIPVALTQLGDLKILGLWSNQLSGGIPPQIGNLSSLELLLLSQNPLGGEIPPEIAHLSNLWYCALWDNQLTGSIPSEMAQLTQLVRLYLGFNILDGEIPHELGQLTNLESLGLSSNHLGGEIPPELGQLENLEVLQLEWNSLSGPIPPEFGNLAQLTDLGLAGNLLNGELPPELAGLDNLWFLFLSYNDFSGQIPAWLGSLPQLSWFGASSNEFTGTIPAEFGNLENLYALDLSDNHLEGALPNALSTLENLNYLYLRGNMFNGSIPSSFAQLEQLRDDEGLDLRWNALHSDNHELATFLDSKQLEGSWQDTQTVAPTDIIPDQVGAIEIDLAWEPIVYAWDNGSYVVGISLAPAGPFELAGITDDKFASRLVITELTPETTYYLAMQTRTLPHNLNRNMVESETSEIISITTLSDTACRLSCEATAPIKATAGSEISFGGTVSAPNCDPPLQLFWNFGDGATSTAEDPQHTYESPGIYQWTFTVTVEDLQCEETGSITVFGGDADCGNGVCEVGESAWTCPDDCGFNDEETGRAGTSATQSAIPAAVGGIEGVGGTYWVSEAMVFNPGLNNANITMVFTPDGDPGSRITTGPQSLKPGAALFYANVVEDVFSVNSNGSILVNSDEPLMLVTRTFNDQETGTYGQFLGAVATGRIFGIGDTAYLIGLSENAAFRTNILLQEVTGRTSRVEVIVYESDGTKVGRKELEVTAGVKRQESLLRLGFDNLTDGYCTVKLLTGGGIVAIASVVDQLTGDAMTIDALHPYQVQFDRKGAAKILAADFSWTPLNPMEGETVQFTDESGSSAFSWSWSFGDGTTSSEQNPSHIYSEAGSYPVNLSVTTSDFGASFITKTITVTAEPVAMGNYLLAVAARWPGAESTTWRSDLWVLNPLSTSQNVSLEYRPHNSSAIYNDVMVVQAGQQISITDVVGEIFPKAGDSKGPLMISATEGVFVNSRNYNLGGNGTFGQAIPALGGGDLIANGESGVLLKIKSTPTVRCNIGFTEFDGLGTTVKLELFSADVSVVTSLASKTYTVGPFRNFQVNRVFESMNLDPEFDAALAVVTVTSGGRIYAYASNVDNATGDGEFILAIKR